MQPLLRELLNRAWSPGVFWNVNLPHVAAGEPDPKIVYCPLEQGPLPLSFRLDGAHFHYDGDYHGRTRQPGSDVDVCFGGNIAVTELRAF